MFAIPKGLRSTSRLSGVIARSIQICTNTIACTPPEAKISAAEKLFVYTCFTGIILGLPMYFVPNFKNYREKKSK